MAKSDNRWMSLFEHKVNNILLDEPMKNHTSFKVGGPVDLYIEPENQEELSEAVRILKKNKIPYYLIGNGSNLLVSDQGLRGAVIKIGDKLSRIEIIGSEIIVEAGALLSTLSKMAARHGLTGLEYASGIPGSLGGAIAMNAGAYGGEMKDVVLWVDVLDEKLEMKRLTNSDMQFAYRRSIIEPQGLTVIRCALELHKGEQQKIDALMAELAAKRKEKQPLHLPSAGSTFKRPEGNFASKLIDEAGLRGFSIGDAQVSPLHCGFVVNNGNATAGEVYSLIRHVQKVVYEKFNVQLETEVKLLGSF